MDAAWRRPPNRVPCQPVVYGLEFRIFSDGLEHAASDTGTAMATTASQDTTTTATATATTSAPDPGPGRCPPDSPPRSRHGPTTALRAAPPQPTPTVDGSAASLVVATAAAAANDFPRFLDLPPELRLRVWEELIQPRIVMVACCPTSPASHPDRTAKLAQLRARQRQHRSNCCCCLPPAAAAAAAAAAATTRTTTKCPPRRPAAAVPVLLHACRESRALALRHYEPAFAWRAPLPTVPAAPSDYDGESRPAAPARIYFNFALDALYLMGQLDREDAFGFVGSPLAYYLDRRDAARVRHVAVALEELMPPRREPSTPPTDDGGSGGGGDGGGTVGGEERVFSSLFHVVDRFSAAERLVVACTARDVEESKERQGGGGGGSSWSPPLLAPLPGEDNVIQKIWRGWLGGTSVVSSTLLDKKILMVREEELQDFIRAHL
ncbi:hypothetical protein RB594_003851 [Gaeumannomyces avenae]